MTEPRYPYVHVGVTADGIDAVAAELWSLGAGGVETRDDSTLSGPDGGGATLVAYFADEGEARSIAEKLGARFPTSVEVVVGDAWRDAWRAYFKPSRVGARLVVRPSWESVRCWPGEVVLTIDPGRAFGSGIHESTRLVLREVDRRVRRGHRVLDVGTGSGILAIAAALLGAKRVDAIDEDADVIPVLRENAQANGVASRISASDTPVERVDGVYELVLANIEAKVLVPLAPAIAARVAPGGTLVLSGVLRDQRDAVRAAYPELDLLLVGAEGEWISLVLGRPRGRKRPKR